VPEEWTAGSDSWRSSSVLAQAGQAGVDPERTSVSNWCPQLLQEYSKMGMGRSVRSQAL
jgi:hypothetical protein